jgi:anti-sigma factor RsiW
MSAMRECARYAPMLTAREGELTAEEERGLHLHLAGCEACQARLADERALDGLVGDALLAEANRVDFSGFVDAVMERVGEGERPGALAGLRRFWRRHRVLALGSAIAPAAAAAALVVYLARSPSPAEGAMLAAVDVSSEDGAAMVLQTRQGPVVLLGVSDDGT